MNPCSMWPLLKRDGLGIQYTAVTLLWNYVLGYNPFKLEASFVKVLSLVSDCPRYHWSLALKHSSGLLRGYHTVA